MHPIWQQHCYRAIVHYTHNVVTKAGHAMCLACGAWTTGNAKLLALECNPHGLTKARASGIDRFKRGLHPCKPKSLAQEHDAWITKTKLVISKVGKKELHTKRVAQAIEAAPRVAKRSHVESHSEPSTASSSQTPPPPIAPVLASFDDPDGDVFFQEEEEGPGEETGPPDDWPDAEPHQVTCAPKKQPAKKLTKAQKQKQQAEGLARVVQGLKAKFKRFQ